MRLNNIHILVFLVFSSCLLSKLTTETKLKNIFLYNSVGNKFLFKDSLYSDSVTKYFVIYNSMNCKDCFIKLNNTFESVKDKSQLYIISTVNNKNSYSIQSAIIDASNKIKLANNFYFEIAEQESLFEYKYSEKGMFKSLNIKVTPCVLRYKNGKVGYFPYEVIFGKRGYSESWL